MDGWMDGQTDKRTDRQTARQIDRSIDRLKHRWIAAASCVQRTVYRCVSLPGWWHHSLPQELCGTSCQRFSLCHTCTFVVHKNMFIFGCILLICISWCLEHEACDAVLIPLQLLLDEGCCFPMCDQLNEFGPIENSCAVPGMGWVVINWILRVFWTSDLAMNFLMLGKKDPYSQAMPSNKHLSFSL